MDTRKGDTVEALTESVLGTLKRARTRFRRQRVTEPCTVTCHRCGGKGGSEAWRYTGFTCFRCGGAGGWPGTRRVYTDPSAEAQDIDITRIMRHLTREAGYRRLLAEAPARRARARYLDDWSKAIEEDRARSIRPVPTGRVTITGMVVSTRTEPGYAYGSSVHKMLVEGEGWRVWGTVPSALYDGDPITGRRVAFVATVESGKDADFGFFKRPAKARYLEEA